MAVRIRLRRVGAKKQPSYRVVVADSRSPRDGRFIDIIGFYNPRTKPTTITIDAEKARKWLGNGAMPTESVASLLFRAGIVDMRSPRWRTGAAPAEAPAESVTEAEEPAPATRKRRAKPDAEAGAAAPGEPEPAAAVANAPEPAAAVAEQPEPASAADAEEAPSDEEEAAAPDAATKA